MEKSQSTLYGDDADQATASFYIPSHTDSGTSEYPHAYPPAIRRQRLRSLPLGLGDDVADLFRRSMHLGHSSQDTFISKDDKGKASSSSSTSTLVAAAPSKPAKPETRIRGLIRRASVSLLNHAKPRRASHSHADMPYDTAGARPTTSGSAWHKLKSAASFRHTRAETVGYGYRGHHEALRAYDDIYEPIPGRGNAPPIIPRRVGGEAARATAAAQNEMLRRAQLVEKELYLECESAVELALPQYWLPRREEEEDEIVRIDFVGCLPEELAVHILSMLDHRGLAQASEVSRRWYEVANTNYVWKESFYRDNSATFAMDNPVKPGTGLGLPPTLPDKEWKQVYKARQQLDRNWREGEALAVYLYGHTDSIYCVQFDEHKIITGSRDKTFRVWDIHTYKCLLVIGSPETVSSPSLLQDAAGAPTHYAEVSAPQPSTGIQSLSPYTTGHSTPTTLSYPTHHDASILCLQYDASILVTGSSDGTCIIHSIADSYAPIRRLTHHTAAVLNLAFDDTHIVTCSKDCTIAVFLRSTGALVRHFRGHTGPVNAVQLRGNVVVSCSGDFSVRLWNIDSGRCVREFSGHTKGLACSQLSEDGRLIASAGNDQVIRVWDAHTGACLRVIDAHEVLVRSLHIDSVSGRLISGSYDHGIKVFDLETGQLLLDFPKWHASWVLGARSDYRRIVSTGQIPKVLIMDFGGNVEGVEALESKPQLPPGKVEGSGEADAWVKRDEEERRIGWVASRS
ncbi:hypothetical protein V497_07285 [Pseudogymnoascus sp. VKM F-4516 (FW-969)]|nr:hypothetical protein V497_07285 [Pseudogymnoascus sp. VKM F-4516 (FW-969)]